MSAESCQAVKKLMKEAIGILQSGTCGVGRGTSLAMTYLEDAALRIDFHMQEKGWNLQTPVVIPPAPSKTSTLKPAAAIPQLRTGLMGTPVGPAPEKSYQNRPTREVGDVLEDISLL